MTPTSLIPISTLVYSRHRLLHPHSSLIPTNIQARTNAHLLTYIHLHTRSLTHISHSGSVYLHVLPCCTKDGTLTYTQSQHQQFTSETHVLFTLMHTQNANITTYTSNTQHLSTTLESDLQWTLLAFAFYDFNLCT